MTTARDLMTEGAEYLKEDTTVAEAAKKLAAVSSGAVPVCDVNGHLRGVVTDRDLVVDVVAAGKSPEKTKLIDLVQGEAVTIGADDSIELAITTMKDHKVRRLPVIDGDKLVGMLSQADIARACPPDRVGDLVAAISEPGS
ncbi:MAG TPA: CBS domain-containing protein [Mycobacteriales bacterium]|nr:CBS domain-containing protein [Mycobacteriales bacterium]